MEDPNQTQQTLDPRIDTVLPKPQPVKRNWWITSTMVFAILFLIMSYLYYASLANQNVEKTLQKAFEKTTPSPTPAATETDWKTYTNDILNFSIKYPSSFELKRCGEIANCSGHEYIALYSKERFGSTVEPIIYSINFVYENNPRQESFERYVKNDPEWSEETDIKIRKDRINSMNVYRVTEFFSANGGEIVYFPTNDNNFVGVSFSPYDNEDPYIEQGRFYTVFNEILYTFKFLDEPSHPS